MENILRSNKLKSLNYEQVAWKKIKLVNVRPTVIPCFRASPSNGPNQQIKPHPT